MNKYFLIMACGLMFALTGCKSKKKAAGPMAGFEKLTEKNLIDFLSLKPELEQNIRFSGGAKFSDGGTSQSFNLDVRISRDSVIQLEAAVPLLGIKVGKLVLWPDSVLFINRMEKTYFTASYEYLQKTFGVPARFDWVQNILLARPAYTPTIRDKQSLEKTEGYQVHLTPENGAGAGIAYIFYSLVAETLALKEQSLFDGKNTFTAKYSDFKDFQEVAKPTSISMSAPPEYPFTLQINVQQYTLGEPVVISTTIPRGYARQAL